MKIEQYGSTYVVSDPSTGALSKVSAQELVALFFFCKNASNIIGLEKLFLEMGYPAENTRSLAAQFSERMTREGWLRTSPPEVDEQPLQAVYFTITRQCNFRCPYCYQGLLNRSNTNMEVERAEIALRKIAALNPACHLAVTGGEPFAHKDAFQILDAIASYNLKFSLLTNGTFLNETVVNRLAENPTFCSIQISIDGITKKTHEITRGKGNFHKVMEGINCVIKRGLPFILAPTIHEDNLHEIMDIAYLAISNGGWFSPNNLREFPYDANHGQVRLSNESLFWIIQEVNKKMIDTFGETLLAERAKRLEPPNIKAKVLNGRFVCGLGYSLLDIDWNGDVYPCHLLKDEHFILGNIFEVDFEQLFAVAQQRNVRVKANQIEKCSSCPFVSTCGGGCKAGAFYSYGTFYREDNLCDILYKFHLQSMLQSMLPYNRDC